MDGEEERAVHFVGERLDSMFLPSFFELGIGFLFGLIDCRPALSLGSTKEAKQHILSLLHPVHGGGGSKVGGSGENDGGEARDGVDESVRVDGPIADLAEGDADEAGGVGRLGGRGAEQEAEEEGDEAARKHGPAGEQEGHSGVASEASSDVGEGGRVSGDDPA